MTLDQIRENADEKKKIDFDEKEAKIKQKQDVETAHLRTQQSRAESVRSSIADALFSGQLEGTGMEGQAKQYMETITQQLAESEQAKMRGGKLSFKGIPALEELKGFSAKMQEQAKEKAKDIAHAARVKAWREGSQPIVTAIDAQTGMISQQLSASRESATSMKEVATSIASITTGATLGVGPVPPSSAMSRATRSYAGVDFPAPEGGGPLSFTNRDQDPVGLSNYNLVMNARAGQRFGDRNSTPGALQTKEDGATPGVSPTTQTPDSADRAEIVAAAIATAVGAVIKESGGTVSLDALTTTALQNIGPNVALALGSKPLLVEVQSGSTVEIGQASLANLANVLNTANVAGTGADVTVGFENRITAIESVIGPGDVDTRIAVSTEAIALEVAEAKQSNDRFLVEVREDRRQLTEKVDGLSLRISPAENDIRTLSTALDRTNVTADTESKKLTIVEDTVRRAEGKADAAQSTANRKKDR